MLMKVKLGAAQSLGDAAKALEVDESTLDADFGVVLIDPEQDLFAVRTRDNSSPRQGGYADPVIEPLGRVKRD